MTGKWGATMLMLQKSNPNRLLTRASVVLLSLAFGAFAFTAAWKGMGLLAIRSPGVAFPLLVLAFYDGLAEEARFWRANADTDVSRDDALVFARRLLIRHLLVAGAGALGYASARLATADLGPVLSTVAGVPCAAGAYLLNRLSFASVYRPRDHRPHRLLELSEARARGDELCRTSGTRDPLSWAGVSLPHEAWRDNWLAVGAQGTGKSVFRDLWAQSWFHRVGRGIDGGTRVFWFDAKTTDVPFLAVLAGDCPRTRILCLHPFEDPSASTDKVVRRAVWNIAGEIASAVNPYAYCLDIATAFAAPTQDGAPEHPFFQNALVFLLTGVLYGLHKVAGPDWMLADFLRAATSLPVMRYVCAFTPETQDRLGLLMGEEELVSHVLSTLCVRLMRFEAVAAAMSRAPKEHYFTLREWIESEDVLVLPYSTDSTEALQAMNRLLTSLAAKMCLSRSHLPDRSIPNSRKTNVFVLDEARVLAGGPIPYLPDLLSFGRESGCSTFLAVQSVGRFREVMGKENANELLGLARNALFFSGSDHDTLTLQEQRTGERELFRRVPVEGKSDAGDRYEKAVEPLVPQTVFRRMRPPGRGGTFVCAAEASSIGACWFYEAPFEEVVGGLTRPDPAVPGFAPMVDTSADALPPLTRADLKRLRLPETLLAAQERLIARALAAPPKSPAGAQATVKDSTEEDGSRETRRLEAGERVRALARRERQQRAVDQPAPAAVSPASDSASGPPRLAVLGKHKPR